MTWTQEDYTSFRGTPAAARAAWLRDRFPSGPPAAWWIFVTEAAQTDLNTFGDLSMEQRRASVRFATEAVELAVTLHSIRPCLGVSLLSGIARAASHARHLENLPEVIGADALARRALEALPLSETAALAAAERRRREAIEDENAWSSPGAPLSGQPLPPDEDITKLSEIEDMLASLEWLADRVTPGAQADQLHRWQSLRGRFELGAAAAEAGRRRLETKDQ